MDMKLGLQDSVFNDSFKLIHLLRNQKQSQMLWFPQREGAMTEILKKYPESLLHPDICDCQDCDLKNKFDRRRTTKKYSSSWSVIWVVWEMDVSQQKSFQELPMGSQIHSFLCYSSSCCIKYSCFFFFFLLLKAHAGWEAESVRYLASLLLFQGPIRFFLPLEKQQRKEALQRMLLICASSSACSDRPGCGSSCCQPACRWLHPAGVWVCLC